MSDRQNDNLPDGGDNTRTRFFIGLGALILSLVSLGLCFSPLGVYALICAVLLAITSLSFLNAQQKRNPFAAVKAVKIAAYVLLAIYLTLFAGGMIYSIMNS